VSTAETKAASCKPLATQSLPGHTCRLLQLPARTRRVQQLTILAPFPYQPKAILATGLGWIETQRYWRTAASDLTKA